MALDGPLPQFRSHGRIDGTGPGNFRARLSCPSARHSCRCCKQSLRCVGERESRAVENPTARAVPRPACAVHNAEGGSTERAIAAGAVNVELA